MNRSNKRTYTGKYYAYCLVYYERYQYVFDAIDREKEIKGRIRQKKSDGYGRPLPKQRPSSRKEIPMEIFE